MILALAPNHLGDGVLALPALHALAPLGLAIAGPRWVDVLYRDVPRRTGEARAAVLFGPSLRQALRALGVPRRIGTATDGRGPLLTDRVPEHGHRIEVYARLAAVLGVRAEGPPRWVPRAGEAGPRLPRDHVGLNPLAGGGAVREWSGFRALADRLAARGVPVVFYAGPGEEARLARIAGPHPTAAGLTLPAFAAALAGCRTFVSNDSGAAHFARAVGADVLVIHGSSSPSRTGPPGARAVLGPRPACAPCDARACAPGHRACLSVAVDEVLARVDA